MYKMKSNEITPSFQLMKTLLLFLPHNATKSMWILPLYKYIYDFTFFYNIILNAYNILHSTQYSFYTTSLSFGTEFCGQSTVSIYFA